MGDKKGIEVSIAVAEAVKLADVDVVCAYPITPQTHVVEHLSEFVANGELDAEFIPVESEHSAMAVSAGSSAVGARTFTCTSSQGLALMSEIVYITASLRLPVVMTLMNRSLSGPLSIWNDHSDVMSVRDCGWIQVFGENGQEMFDLTIVGFRVAEDKNVLLPFMVNGDGFILSHVIEPIVIPEQDLVKKYLPPYIPEGHRLHPDKPITMGCFAMPNLFSETKKAQQQALKDSMSTILKGLDEWGKITGRYYKPIETYKTEGAETLFVTMGSFGETASVAVDELRGRGEKVGLLKIRLWRPFPFDDFRKVVAGVKKLIVIDRAVSFGAGGPVATQLRSVLYGEPNQPVVINMIAGLGGRDVGPQDFTNMYQKAQEMAKNAKEENFHFYGARE